MNPVRVDLTVALAGELGVLDRLPTVPAPDATDDDLVTVHHPALIEAVMAASAAEARPDLLHGLGSDDNPIFPNMHQASRHVVGASLEAARQVWTGQVDHAANIAGGLHHAMPDRVSGFCVYNDVAVAIRWLLENGAERVAYVDVDVHHGDGVESIFYDDPRVLYVSTHEAPLYPGTGLAGETGGPAAPHSNLNLPFPAGTRGDVYRQAFDDVIAPIVALHRPDWLFISAGFDGHRNDPLAGLELTSGDYADFAVRLQALVPARRTVVVLEGGYDFDALSMSTGATLAAMIGASYRPEAASGGDIGLPTINAAKQRWGLPA